MRCKDLLDEGMTKKHIIKQLTAKDTSFIYTMMRPEDVTIDLIIKSSVSCDITCTVTMNAKRGTALVRSIVLPTNNAVISFKIKQTHNAPYTKSSMRVSSVITDKSSVICQGNVYIGERAEKSDAYQKNINLLCGEGGVVISSPILEILQNDVSCSHGVTTSTIPDDVLWYCKTRGISEVEAKALFVDGFIRDSIGDNQDNNANTKVV